MSVPDPRMLCFFQYPNPGYEDSSLTGFNYAFNASPRARHGGVERADVVKLIQTTVLGSSKPVPILLYDAASDTTIALLVSPDANYR